MSTPEKELAVAISWMARKHIPEVLRIEGEAYKVGSGWEEEDFLRCLRRTNHIGMVAESADDDKLVGFVVYELHKRKLIILDLAVEPASQGRGVGRRMMKKLIDKLGRHERVAVEVDVRETNLKAQKFFASCGFKAFRVIRGYFDDTGEDAYRFQYHTNGVIEEIPDDEDNWGGASYDDETPVAA